MNNPMFNMSEFFYDNFVRGWNASESYNLFDTLAYAVLAILLTALLFKVLKGRVKFDSKLMQNIFLFIVLGSIIRVYADYGVYPRFFLTVTPGIWIMMMLLFLFSLFIDKMLKKNLMIKYIPIILILCNLAYFSIKNYSAIPLYAIFFAVLSAPFIIWRKKFPMIKDDLSLYALLSHIFDAVSTFVNIDFFNYIEIHIVGGFFTQYFHTGLVMYFLKLIVLLPLLYYLNKEKDKEFSDFIKIIICVLGLGPGIRNFITILVGV